MCVGVGPILHPVFQSPEQVITALQASGEFGVDDAFVGQPLQRVHGHRRLQARMPAAPEQLLGVDEEFDIPDAAAAELEVETSGLLERGLVPAFTGEVGVFGADAGLEVGDLLDHREIKVSPPEVGMQAREQRLTRRPVARDHACLDHRQPPPRRRPVKVVVLGGLGRHRQVGHRRVGPQPPVGAPDEPSRTMPVDGLVEGPQHPRGDIRAPDEGWHRHGVRIIESHQIDIAGKIQITAAELAQPEDEQPRHRSRGVEVGGNVGRGLPGAAPGCGQRGIEAGVGVGRPVSAQLSHRGLRAIFGDILPLLRLLLGQHAGPQRAVTISVGAGSSTREALL